MSNSTTQYSRLVCLTLFFGLMCGQIEAQHYPVSNEKLLFIGQDLNSVADYRNDCVGCHPGHGETSYLFFYGLEESYIYIDASREIHFGALDMDNSGVENTNMTNWGAGDLNLWAAAERSPLINIGLSIVEDQFFGQDGLQKIINGDHDSKIAKLTSFFNQFPNNIFYLRIGYEFDGSWNGYNAAKYKGAFQRIVEQMRPALNRDNVEFVWQSCTSPIDDIIDGGQENLANYYPGDQYVDWMGLSWFLKPNENPTLGSITPATQLILVNELLSFAQSKNKPIMIAEAAPQGYDLSAGTNCNISSIYDGNAATGCVAKTAIEIYQEWFEPILNFMATNDEVRAISYINANWDSQFTWGPASNYGSGYWGDTRVEADTAIMGRWINAIANPSNQFLQTENPMEILNAVSTVSIEKGFESPLEIKIFPNPSQQLLHLEGSESSYQYTLLNLEGDTLLIGKGAEIDIAAFPAGVYLLKIDGSTAKIIKQ
ncbi:MAG: T9SS type A sorting domain-containing protein [Bacteroidia bacterium]